MNRKKIFLLLAAITATVTMIAADLTGRVLDPEGEPLMLAVIRLMCANADSTYVANTTADTDGNFKFTGLRAGKYILETKYVGCKPNYVDVELGNQNHAMSEAIRMLPDGNVLDEVSVTGIRTPMRVATDTVEFTADSYVTRPNAVVEDLLKHLPGVEVGSDGSITANGKQVTKILIDGKEFFSDDPQVASKNLPAQMVDRLQVIDRRSDLARLTGVDDGEDETVINLTVKKGMQNGWFGTAQGGYGNDDRYLGTFNLSRFNNGNQFTFLGNFNNINEIGFTDSNGNRFRRFGGNNGITSSRALGLNFNVGNGDIFRVGGDILYSRSDKDTRQRSERRYLFTDSTSYNSSYSNTRDRGRNLRADFRILWQPDSFNTLEIRPNFSWNLNNSNSLDTATTRAGDPYLTPVNFTRNSASSHGHSIEAATRVIFTHNFARRRGRSVSFMGNWRHSTVRERENTHSYNKFFLLDDDIDEYDQYMTNHTWSNTLMGRVTWTEPIGDVANGNFLVFAYRMTYRWNSADKEVYDADDINPELYNKDLSNSFRNRFFTQDIRLGYKKVTRTTTAEAGLSLIPSASSSTNLTDNNKSIPTRHVFNVAPFLRYRYKMSRNQSVTVNYRSRASEPSMTQLQPVADMSNPLNIKIGNPDLDPSFSHNIMARFQSFNPDAQQSIMTMAFINITQNSIVSKTDYDATTGGQTTTYVNVNGVWNGRLMGMFSRPLRNKLWTVNSHMFVGFDRSVGFTNGKRNATLTTSFNIEPAIAFRPSNFEMELRPVYRLQTTHSSMPNSIGRTVHAYGFKADVTAYTNHGLTLNTDLNFNATSGYANGYDTSLWMWNAQLSQEFLKDRSLTVALKINDILNQTQNVRRTVTANYIQDTDYNTLGRYGMITLTYKFNTFGSGNQPSTNNIMYPHGGHMGPPPGGGRPPRP